MIMSDYERPATVDTAAETKWRMVMAGWYTNAPERGDLTRRPYKGYEDAGDFLQYSEEFEDWKAAGNVEEEIMRSYAGEYRIANAPVGTWVLITNGHVDCEPFATLTDAMAYAEEAIDGGWHQ